MFSGENWCWSRLVTRWILKSLTTRETRSRGAQRVIEKKVEINSKNDLAQLFKSLHNFFSQDLPVVFPFRFPPSITLRAPSVTLFALRYPLAFQIETGDEVRTNNKLNAVADPGEGAGGARGARACPLFLDQNEAWREAPPPSLIWWSGSATAMPYVVWVLFPFSATTKRVGFLLELWCFPFHKIGHVQFLIVGRGWRWLDVYRVCKGNTHPLLRACVFEIFPFPFAPYT